MESQQNFSNNTPVPALPHKSVSHWVVVVLAIIAVIGYFMASYAFGLWPFNSLIPPLATPAPSPVAAVTSTDGWQTYTNTEYGFEFKYPATWEYKEIENFPGIIWFSEDFNSIAADMIMLRIGRDDPKKTLDELALFVARDFSYDMLKPYYDPNKFLTLANVRAIQTRLVKPETPPRPVEGWKPGLVKTTIAVHNDTVFIVQGTGKVETTEKTYDQILSTFKFIDSQDLFLPVKPLFEFSQNNPSWTAPENSEGEYYYRDWDQNIDYLVKGQKITGIATIKNTQWGDFQRHYDLKLVSTGWEQDPKFGADGAISSLWGYKKGNQRIIFEWSGAPTGQGWNTFKIISGTLQN